MSDSEDTNLKRKPSRGAGRASASHSSFPYSGLGSVWPITLPSSRPSILWLTVSQSSHLPERRPSSGKASFSNACSSSGAYLPEPLLGLALWSSRLLCTQFGHLFPGTATPIYPRSVYHVQPRYSQSVCSRLSPFLIREARLLPQSFGASLAPKRRFYLVCTRISASSSPGSSAWSYS